MSGLKNLTVLSLTDTKVTNEGLRHISGLKNLTWLVLWDTKVTDEGIARLKAALPGLEIRQSAAS